MCENTSPHKVLEGWNAAVDQHAVDAPSTSAVKRRLTSRKCVNQPSHRRHLIYNYFSAGKLIFRLYFMSHAGWNVEGSIYT